MQVQKWKRMLLQKLFHLIVISIKASTNASKVSIEKAVAWK